MAYSKSPQAFTKVEAYLAQLVNLPSGDAIEFSDINPSKLAHSLREGIRSAAANDIAPYKDLVNKFKFRIYANRVICEQKSISNFDKQMAHTISNSLIFNDVVNIMEVLNTIIDNQEAKLLEFPNFKPSEDEIVKLTKYCLSKELAISTHPNLTIRNMK